MVSGKRQIQICHVLSGTAADQGAPDAGRPDDEGGDRGLLPAAAHPHRPLPRAVPDDV